MNLTSDIRARLEQAKTNSISDQINLALEIGCEVTNTDLGIVSLITNDTDYTVKYVYPQDAGLEVGTVFELGNTYCDLTFGQGDLVSIDHMAKSEYKLHPCYSSFKIESYIGDVYRENKQVICTVNFSSVPPLNEAFNESHKETVRFLARYIGEALEKARP